MIELADAISQYQRMVIGQGADPRGQTDIAGALGDRGNKHFRRGNAFIGAAVVLSNPGFVIGELVQPLDQLHIALDGQRRVDDVFVEGCEKGTEFHALRFVSHNLSSAFRYGTSPVIEITIKTKHFYCNVFIQKVICLLRGLTTGTNADSLKKHFW